MGDALCTTCQVEEDICHMLYECPKYRQLRCRQQTCVITALRAYRERNGPKGITTAQAFWTRGILPASVLGPCPRGAVAGKSDTIGGDDAVGGTLRGVHTVWTDGSGRFPTDPRLRTCTWAIYAGPTHPEMWMAGVLPGMGADDLQGGALRRPEGPQGQQGTPGGGLGLRRGSQFGKPLPEG